MPTRETIPPCIKIVVPRMVARNAAGALYTGTFNRDLYIRFGVSPERLWFSPWAVDNSRFGTQSRDAERSRLGLREDIVYFLFVGTLIPRKNVEALLRVISRMQVDGKRVGALLAASGPESDRFAELSADLAIQDVHWLGFVNQSELPRVYAAADVFALASWTDPRATVVNEAMASGLPVIISSGTGIWGPGDLVRHGSEGLVFPVGDDAALQECCTVLLDEAARTRMGRAGRDRVTRHWSYDVAAQGWTDAIHAVTA